MKSISIKYLKTLIIIIAITIGSIAFLVTGKNDSPIEQFAEEILLSQGVQIDFSPDD